jgi:ribosomal protein S18 acetylase RimI-like enzyme
MEIKQNFTIRPAQEGDLPRLKSLMLEYIVDFYGCNPPDDERLEALMTQLLEQKEGIQFVADNGEKLAGFATLYFTFSTLRASRVVVMNDLYVVEEQRGRDVAAALVQACRRYTAQNGFAGMSWVTAHDNHRAQRFYDKIGGEREEWITYNISPEF